MSLEDRDVVVGIFDDPGRAEEAYEALDRAGFGGQIGYLRPTPQSGQGVALGTDDSKMAEGAVAGAAVGGIGGALAGAALAGLIPGIGPVIAVGTLAAVLGGAAAGATSTALFGAALGAGFTEDEAKAYEGEFRRGHALVTVRSSDRLDEARRILEEHGARFTPQGGSGSGSGSDELRQRTELERRPDIPTPGRSNTGVGAPEDNAAATAGVEYARNLEGMRPRASQGRPEPPKGASGPLRLPGVSGYDTSFGTGTARRFGTAAYGTDYRGQTEASPDVLDYGIEVPGAEPGGTAARPVDTHASSQEGALGGERVELDESGEPRPRA